MIFALIIVITIVLITAFLSSAEVALIAISDSKVEDDIENGVKKAILIQKFNQNGRRYLSNVQVLHMLLLLVYGIFYPILLKSLNAWPVTGSFIEIFLLILWIFIGFMIYMVFGHMVARRAAIKWTNSIAYMSIKLILLLIWLSSPITYLFDGVSKVFTRLFFNMNYDEGIKYVTEEEIRTLVEASGKKGVIDEEESEMIHNIFDFDETNVEQIMTHRTEISAISADSSKLEVISYVTNEKFTRFPVYENDIDNIIGTLHVKDLLRYLENEAEIFDLKTLVRKAYYIPDSKKIRELFYEMKKSKNHIAIVIDEYGGTAGIITIEDLIEEIVGNIFDEYDDVEEDVIKRDENTYEIDGLASIDDIEDIIEGNLPVDDYDTLSGFILGFLGRFPEEGENIEFRYRNFTYKILEIKDRVITKVLATRNNQTDGEESNTEE